MLPGRPKRTAARAMGVLAGLLIMAPFADATTYVHWDGNGGIGGAWESDPNWNPDSVPSNADYADSVNVYIHENNSAGSPVMVTTVVDDIQKLYVGRTSGGSAGVGYLTVSGGGTLHILATVGVGSLSGSTGVLQVVAGGTFTVADNQATAIGAAGDGTFVVGDATVHIPDDLEIGAGTGQGTMVVSDGADISLNQDFRIGGGTGSGLLVLDGSRTGSGDDIVNTRGGTDRFLLFSNATLRVVIDQDAVNDPSRMRKVVMTGTTNSDSNGRFHNGAVLDPQFDSGTTRSAGVWTIVTTVTGLVDDGLALSASALAAGWSFDTSDGTTLTITYTPPSGGTLITVR